MSSRIRRAEPDAGSAGSEDAQPIQWRVFGQPSGQARAAQLLGGQPGQPRKAGAAELQPADAERLEQARAAAYQQGVAAGEASATQRAQAKLDPALASFSAIVAELAASRKKLRVEAETAAVALALEVARRVLHREVAADPEAILGLVKAAFQKCDARSTERLRISPPDAEAIGEHRARLNFPQALEIIPDRSLPRGSVIFETSRGDLDASVDTQLAEIERGLADVLKRRHP